VSGFVEADMDRPEAHPEESWFGERIQGPGGVIARPGSEAEIAALLRDHGGHPSPVRPSGSRHSMTPCISALAPGGAEARGPWGTLVDLRAFTRLCDAGGLPTAEALRIDTQAGTVRVPAGRTFIEVAHELRDRGLQLRVNTELGTLTMGAAACGATKDSSFPGEPGQVCTDVVGMRLVTPGGDVVELNEGDPDLEALRCSYGLFGIVTEVTCRVEPHQDISIRHERLRLEEFASRSARWAAEGQAVFLYLFPHGGRIVAELRGKASRGPGSKEHSLRLETRNFFWEKGLHQAAKFVGFLPGRLQQLTLDGLDRVLQEYFTKTLQIERVSPVSQVVDFDRDDPEHRFTFSMWAFPEHEFPGVLREYFDFCSRHAGDFRTLLPHVSYRIGQDRSSVLSYSFDHPVWTLDPIAPHGEPGWERFLREFNDFCSARGAVPLLNQTPFLERRHVARAFGERLSRFEAARRRFDPQGRMLNAYFAELLGVAPPAQDAP
jgi:FAD/FMN-containing dehydrogenase